MNIGIKLLRFASSCRPWHRGVGNWSFAAEKFANLYDELEKWLRKEEYEQAGGHVECRASVCEILNFQVPPQWS
jgi:hypothetical protein